MISKKMEIFKTLDEIVEINDLILKILDNGITDHTKKALEQYKLLLKDYCETVMAGRINKADKLYFSNN